MEYYYEGGSDDGGHMVGGCGPTWARALALGPSNVVVVRYSVQDAKTHKRAFTLRTKIALPNRQKSTSASEQHDKDDTLIVNRQYGEPLHLEQLY